MKNIQAFTLQKLSFVFGWTKEIEKDISFYSKNTELLGIWTVMFLIIAGLFFVAIQSTVLVMFSLLLLSAAIVLAISFFTIYYLHAITYGRKQTFLIKTHKHLNKSFKVRDVFNFIKIPPLSLLFMPFVRLFKA